MGHTCLHDKLGPDARDHPFAAAPPNLWPHLCYAEATRRCDLWNGLVFVD